MQRYAVRPGYVVGGGESTIEVQVAEVYFYGLAGDEAGIDVLACGG